MKNKISLTLAILLLGSLVGAGLFYAIPYSNLSREHASLQDDYLESSDELLSLQEGFDTLSDEVDELAGEYASLKEAHRSLNDEFTYIERGYHDLESAYQSLITANSVLDNRYSELLSEYIRAEDEPIPPFTVRGKYIYDKFGRRVSLNGFQIDEGKFDLTGEQSDDPYTIDDIQQIKDWGFHFVYNNLWWGKVERDQNLTGVYDYSYVLDDFHQGIELCDDSDLYFIFRFRVSNEDATSGQDDAWWGWPTAAYVCTDNGLARYCDFLRVTISRLESRHDNIVAYMPWQWPFHCSGYTVEQETFFYEHVVPDMISAVRSVTDKPIIIAPLHPIGVDFNDLINFDERVKVDDPNVIYAFSYYHPVNHGASSPDNQEIWERSDSDIEEQERLLGLAVDFSNTYNVPLNVLEFGIKIERQDQLDKLEAKLQLLDENDIGWCYWTYSWYESGGITFNLFYPDCTPKQTIIDLLLEYGNWHNW